MTLYMFTPDTSTTSACYGQCAATWPPVLASGKRGAAGLQTSLLGTIQRTDCTTRVTFNGHPLYFFAKDSKPGARTARAWSPSGTLSAPHPGWRLIAARAVRVGARQAPTRTVRQAPGATSTTPRSRSRCPEDG
jgi:secreted repeat protein with Y-X4-D motif